MKPSDRKNKKHRKQSPMIHRSFAIKRGRDTKDIDREMKDSEGNTKRNKPISITIFRNGTLA